MMSDTRNFLHYWRLSPDGRLVFGGRTSFAPVSVRTARDRLYAAMIEIYPQLAGVRVSHAWTGNVGFTFDQLPHLTRSDGITYAMGYCGSGVALGSWMGTLAAEWIAKGARPAFSDSAFRESRCTGGTPGFSHSSARITRCSISSERGDSHSATRERGDELPSRTT